MESYVNGRKRLVNELTSENGHGRKRSRNMSYKSLEGKKEAGARQKLMKLCKTGY